MIVLVGGEKGGTGKSTIATTLAAMRAARGHDVALVDADKQGSSRTWHEERAAQDVAPLACYEMTGRQVHRRAEDLHERYEDVIIDAGGRDSVELRGALVACGYLYTPLQPSYADAWTLDRMETLVDQAAAVRGRFPAYVVLSRAFTDPRIPETEEAAALVAEYELLQDSGVILRERVAWRRAFGLGLSVEEVGSPDQKAVDEAQTMYHHAFGWED